MKRSEMIVKMLDCYRTCILELHYREEHAMERVLEICEETGMRPPQISMKDPGHFTGDSFEYYANEWEPED